MRNSTWRNSITLVALGAIAAATGCQTNSWGLPKLGWSKKAVPTSSIAGTREAPKPPSVTAPSYSLGEPSSLAISEGTPSSAPYGGTATAGTNYPGQPATGPDAYSVGPYAMNSSSPATAPTQQGFYSPTYGSPGPAATTADARAAYPGGSPTYGGSGSYPTTNPSSSATPNGAVSSTTYGTTPSYNTPADYSATNGYAATPTQGSSPTPESSYPATPPSAYPTTLSGAPTSSYGAVPAGGYAYEPGSSGSYYPMPAGTSSLPTGSPSSYGSTGYGGATYETNGSSYGTSGTYDSSAGYETAAPSSGYASSSQEFRPGSTGRVTQPLGAPTHTATPSNSTYPSTYSR